MTRPRLLDLFCGAGGAAMGYHRAGFDVLGVDIVDQPNYPFKFVKHDALEFLHEWPSSEFDAIHASPPCPAYSDLKTMRGVAGNHPELIDVTRELLHTTGLPYVIENVRQSPLAKQSTLDGRHGVYLNGSMFGLEEGEYGLRRERIFETNWPVAQPNGGRKQPMRVSVHGGGQPGREGGRDARVMGIDWMTKKELNDAIPPAYTQYIGHELMRYIHSIQPQPLLMHGDLK